MMAGVTISSALRPLTSGATYQRGVFLLLGGVLALPYVLLGVVFWQLWHGPQPDRATTVFLIGVTVVLATVPAFLPATRAVEIVVCRGLLGVEIPQAPPGHVNRETRMRSALWFALHLVIGGAVTLGLIIVLPIALFFVTQQLGIGSWVLEDLAFGPFDAGNTFAWSLVGFVLLILIAYAVAGLGALAAQLAPALLGPSPAERIAALEAETVELAERNRLARELHDSVGHALTVTTLQAAAARQVLDVDPEFVRRALTAVEETGREAMEDLDRVLGLLRDRDTSRALPRRTLADLHRVLADARSAGVRVDVEVDGAVETVPAAVSREGYRIVQESLTNAAKHVGPTTVSLRISVHGDALEIDIANPLGGAVTSRSRGGGRGLDGMRERVSSLGGQMTAGADGAHWRVSVQLPGPGTGGRR